MKWGVRRYQNPDGSLTPAGEKRQKKKEIQTNPYGQGHNVTAEQNNRRTRDTVRYGSKGVARIEEKIEKGKTYKAAVRVEKGRATVKRILTKAIATDVMTGGQFHRDLGKVSYSAAKSAMNAAKRASAERAARAAMPRLAREMAWDLDHNRWRYV